MSEMIQRIAVLGSGIQLTMSVAILASSLKSFNCQIVAVELPEENNASSVEICGPEFSPLCKILGLNEVDVVRQSNATFRLGDRYLTKGADWFVPFAHMGLKAEQDDFEQGLFQYLANQEKPNLTAYCAASLAAVTGKFAIAGNDREDLRKALDYGVQLDTQKYLACLANVCQQDNVQWLKLDSTEIEFINEQNLSEIRCMKQSICADFWLDVSRTNILSSCLEYEVNPDLLPVSSIAEWSQEHIELTCPYTKLIELDSAWLRVVHLRNRTVYKLYMVAGSEKVADISQQALEFDITLPSNLEFRKVNCQSLGLPWQKNILALGEGSLQLGNFVFSELQVIQAALVQFIDLFPSLPIGKHNRSHYNQEWQKFVQDAVDYSDVHFALGGPNNVNTSESLTQRIKVFERLGRINPMQTDAVTESQWYQILYGLGLRPQLASVVLSKVDSRSLEAGMANVQRAIASLIGGMPPHDQYLNRFYPISSS
ncbi:tryptophan 7-halogenase [Paraglaciecola aquimarina]|uniref:Tryptophan 7-halogenase n=1 Tax=Paraglaciecola algarum TaxID=3050085 RepID=A0ABS9DAV5_9ALTE|nr:tryptophan 7-halogenase [Paraglaciecola sp. G1-23]MCF2948761.1 tryptophan 7-halogenase [Paraglaciecola sp. G1-23]